MPSPYIIKVADYFFTSQELLEKAAQVKKPQQPNRQPATINKQMILSCRGKRQQQQQKNENIKKK